MKTLCLALMLFALPLHAEPLKIPLGVYAAAATADLATTHRMLHYQGITEKNPLGRWIDDKPTQLVIFSAASDVATVAVLHRLIGRQHPTLERVALYSVAGFRFGLAVYNYRGLSDRPKR